MFLIKLDDREIKIIIIFLSLYEAGPQPKVISLEKIKGKIFFVVCEFDYG